MNYYDELLKLTKKAITKNEVPVAALIVYNKKIISKAFNKRHNNNNVLGHAEVIAIQKATKRLKTWHLLDCDLYVTMEPCKMCKFIINEAKIRNVYYLLKSNKTKLYKTNYIFIDSDHNKLFKKQVQNFFKAKR